MTKIAKILTIFSILFISITFAYAQVNPISLSVKPKSTSAELTITYDTKIGTGIDTVTITVTSLTDPNSPGGNFLNVLEPFKPFDGRMPKSGKKTTTRTMTNLAPNTKYYVHVTANNGFQVVYEKKNQAFTTLPGTTNSGVTGTGVTPIGTGTGQTPSGAGTGTTPSGSGTGFGQGQSAETATAPGGLIDCEGASCSFQHLINLVQRGIAFVIRLILPIAAIILAYTGFLFMTSGGNEEVRARAKGILTKTLIGIALILCSVLIVNLLYKAFGVNPCYNWLGKTIEECKTSQ